MIIYKHHKKIIMQKLRKKKEKQNHVQQNKTILKKINTFNTDSNAITMNFFLK